MSIVNEVYNFSEELSPLKVRLSSLELRCCLNKYLSLSVLPLLLSLSQVPSPQLFSKEVLEEVLPSRLQNLYQLGQTTSSTQPATPTSSVATGEKSSNQGSSTGGAAGGGGGTVLNIPQHLLQKLLASASQVSCSESYLYCWLTTLYIYELQYQTTCILSSAPRIIQHVHTPPLHTHVHCMCTYAHTHTHTHRSLLLVQWLFLFSSQH